MKEEIKGNKKNQIDYQGRLKTSFADARKGNLEQEKIVRKMLVNY